MIEITIVLCSWCSTKKPVDVLGAEKVPPGRHAATVQISHGMCAACAAKWNEELKGKSTPGKL